MAAYTTIDDPEAYFQVVLYTGDGSVDQDITFGGTNDMQPDLVWQATRNTTSERNIYDSVRGVKKRLHSEDSEAETTRNGVISFDSDGFSVGDHSGSNTNTNTYANWCWKAGGSGSANEDGSVNTTATSVNSTSKFSIGIYTGTGSAGMTVGHGLGVAPDFIVVKKRGAADRWCAYHSANTSAPETEAIYLSTTDATADDADFWNDVAPSSSLVTFGDKGDINATVTTVMYCWSAVQGFSKFGSYTGNGNADGTFVYTGFRPAWIMCKRSSSTENWAIVDDQRDGYNVDNDQLFANTTAAEITNDRMDILSNGFKCRTTNTEWNASGSTYIYAAFAKAPFVNSNGVPCNAR